MSLEKNAALWVMIDMGSAPMDIEEFLTRMESIIPDLVVDRQDRLLQKALRTIERASHIPYAERIAIMPMVLSDVRLWLTKGPQWNFESERKGLLTGAIRPRSISLEFGDDLDQTVVGQLRNLCVSLPNSEVVVDCTEESME